MQTDLSTPPNTTRPAAEDGPCSAAEKWRRELADFIGHLLARRWLSSSGAAIAEEEHGSHDPADR